MKPERPFQKLSVIRGSLREDEFALYQVEEESKVLREGFRVKRYTTKGIGVDYRVLNHWDEQGILPEGSRETEGQWRKFTLIEAAWIRVALHLRKFGISLPVIAEIRKCVMEWDEKAEGYPFFEFFFLKAITNDTDHYVVYTSDDHADLVSGREMELLKLNPQDMLLVSLKSVAKELGYGVADITPSLALTESEIALLYRVQGSHTKEVLVSKRKGKINDISTEYSFPDDSYLKALTDAMRHEKGFGGITTEFEEGKKQSITVKRKDRFK